MWNLLVFAVIGVLTGAAARIFYSQQQPARILGTLVIGVAGALAGGMLSWIYWPLVEGQFDTGNLILAAGGALLAILIRAGFAFGRNRDAVR